MDTNYLYEDERPQMFVIKAFQEEGRVLAKDQQTGQEIVLGLQIDPTGLLRVTSVSQPPKEPDAA